MYWQGTGCSARTERPGCSYGMAELPMTSKSPWFSSTTNTTWLNRGKVPRGPGLELGGCGLPEAEPPQPAVAKSTKPERIEIDAWVRSVGVDIGVFMGIAPSKSRIAKPGLGRANDLH